MRRLFVLGMLLWAPQVWAQSKDWLPNLPDFWIATADYPLHDMRKMAQSGCTGYSANAPQYSLLMPSDEAAEGNVTATITTQAYDANSNPLSGSIPSHKLTVTPNTWVGFTWSSNNGVSESRWYTVNSNSTRYGVANIGLSGSQPHWWLMGSGDAGNTYHQFHQITDQYGNVTLDHDDVTVVAGSGPSIVDQDETLGNLYLDGRFSFGVPPMAQACQQCINDPSSCTGAQHTPYITATLKNPNTGETRSVSHAVAGNDFDANAYGYGSTDGYHFGISVLPGDGPEPDPSDPPIGEIFCFAVGADIFNQQTSGDNYTWITAKTKVKVLQEGTLGTNGPGITRWYVETWCKDQQHTPIWEPLYIDTKGAATILMSVGQYELSYQECYAEPGWPAWKCLPNAVTPPQPLHIGVGGTKYDCSTLINTPLPK